MFNYKKKWKSLKTVRNTTETEWQEVADYCFPRRDFTTDRTPGTNRRVKLYDSTGTSSVILLASAIHGNLTPVHTNWLSLRSSPDTRPYYDEATKKMLTLFAAPESRFASQAHEFYLDMVAFGTAVMGVFRKDGKKIFRTMNLADCWIAENEHGVIDTLYYCQKFTAEQMIDRFGEEDVHEDVKKCLQDGGEKANKKFKILHVVEPRHDSQGVRGAVANEKAFKSVYLDVDNDHQIGEEGGFDDFPYIVARFSKRSGETYGFSPGMASVSEVKMLNEIVEVMLRAATKNSDPPILSPLDSAVLPMRLDPGGINYYDPDIGPPQFWSNGFRPDYMDALIESKRSDIQRMFFIDFLTLPQRDRMTATEIMQRTQDSFRNMAAVNARMESEFLSSLVRRVFLMMVDDGDIPEPPRQSQGQDLVVEYMSPMAQAQKSISSNAVLQGLSMLAQVAQLDPSVTNLVNAENLARDQLLNTFFMPSDYLRSKIEYTDRVDQQNDLAQSQQTAQNVQGYASGAKDVADALTTLQSTQV